MTKPAVQELRKYLKNKLSDFRFKHSLGVARLAKELAKIHGWDPEKAYLAGLLHDSAKEWKPQKMIAYVKKKKIVVPDFNFIQKNSPNLLHAYVAARRVKEKGWVKDPQIIDAIRSHTLGSLNMRLPEKILYVADFSAYGRQYSAAPALRKEAKNNLDKALMLCMQSKIAFSFIKHKAIHPFVIDVWNKMVKRK